MEGGVRGVRMPLEPLFSHENLLALKAARGACPKATSHAQAPMPIKSSGLPHFQGLFGRLVPLAATLNLAAPPTTPAREHFSDTARSLILRYGITVLNLHFYTLSSCNLAIGASLIRLRQPHEQPHSVASPDLPRQRLAGFAFGHSHTTH
jgi:hypothetical protein